MLQSVPADQLRGGLAECIKHDIIRDAAAESATKVIATAAGVVAGIVQSVSHHEPPANPKTTRCEEDHMICRRDQPHVILLFGPSAAGKSTIARLLAARLARCACIEVDALRYMVVGGLVAWSGGVPPSQAPEEYRRQCWLGTSNAIRLAEGFAAERFSSIIEGLEDDCRPGSGWAEKTFPTRSLLQIAIVCDPAALSQRRRQRGGNGELSPDGLAELDWYRDNASRFDFVLNTTAISPELGVAQLLAGCQLPATGA